MAELAAALELSVSDASRRQATNAGTGDRYLYQAPCLNHPGLCWSVIALQAP